MNLAVRTILATRLSWRRAPSQQPSKPQDEGGARRHVAFVETFAHERVHRLDRDQRVNKRVAPSHRIEFGKLFVTEPPWRRASVPRRPPPPQRTS
jgi:hypothetical protein